MSYVQGTKPSINRANNMLSLGLRLEAYLRKPANCRLRQVERVLLAVS